MYTTDETGPSPGSALPGTYLRLSTLRVACLGALLLLPWVIVFRQSVTQYPGASAAAPSAATAPATAAARTAPSGPVGPWGELEYTPITIEPPEDAVRRLASVDTSIWHLRDYTVEGLARLLTDAGVGDVQRDSLVRAASPDPQGNGLLIRPDDVTLGALTPEARSAIYRVLALDPRNPHSEPFRHVADGTDWFAESGLSKQTVALVRKFVYRRGNLEALVDMSVVLPAIPDADERARVLRALSSQQALIVRLRVRPDSDLEQLVEYWGQGHTVRDVAPLLESLARVPGGGTVDVAQLLPAFARARLNTFPPPVNLDGSLQGIFDCHWTTLNFWNAMPDNSFTDSTVAGRRVDTAYRRLEGGPSQLGDIVMFTNPEGRGIHSAVFIAGDVVFTKNGASIAAPWILARLPEVFAYYEPLGSLKMVTYRRKEF